MKIFVLIMLFSMLTIILNGCSMMDSNAADSTTGQKSKSFEKSIEISTNIDYLLYLPKDISASDKQWPLVMFLHGVGERGSDLEKVKAHGLPKLADKQDFPFIIVSPQCPDRIWWDHPVQIETLNALLDQIIASYPVDPDRVYLTGLSMGGFGTWAFATAHPDKFAAIAPICGGGNPHNVDGLAKLPIWVFHGDNDKVVPISESQEMVDAIKRKGGDIKFTVYPGVGHDSWTETYNNPELYKWMLKHTR